MEAITFVNQATGVKVSSQKVQYKKETKIAGKIAMSLQKNMTIISKKFENELETLREQHEKASKILLESSANLNNMMNLKKEWDEIGKIAAEASKLGKNEVILSIEKDNASHKKNSDLCFSVDPLCVNPLCFPSVWILSVLLLILNCKKKLFTIQVQL